VSQTGFRVSVVCDSVSSGVRLTTFALRCPRVMWAEFLTHRQFSRNAASSRAIPVSHFTGQVRGDPYVPDDLPDGEWCGNRSGMVATEPLDQATVVLAHDEIHRLRWDTVRAVERLEQMGIHKQDVNRYLEPFQWIRAVVTATQWDNFFALRTDHRAYPPFRFLARCMWVAYTRSQAVERVAHLPFITDEDRAAAYEMAETRTAPEWFDDHYCGPVWEDMHDYEANYFMAAWSAARCARVSVKNFRTDGTDRAKDYETFLKLTTEYPRHSSPCEHQAFALDHWGESYPASNFAEPWMQFRKMIPDETVRRFESPAGEVAAWNVPDDVFGGTPGVDW